MRRSRRLAVCVRVVRAGTGRLALETTGHAADTYSVIARLPSAFRATDVALSVANLADCDESLSLIAADMEELVEELGRLRAGALPLIERLAERDALVAEKEHALSRLETERMLALGRADDAAAALRDARDLLDEHTGRATTATRELEELRGVLAERERQLARAERELVLMNEALAERDAALLEERATITELEASRRSGQAPPNSGAAATREAGEPINGHVQFVPFPEGYRLVVSDEPCSRPGDPLEVEGRRYVVTRVGRSPLPADERPCAFLLLSHAAA